MVKAKEFWDFLCNELNYRFFSGVPTSGFQGLFRAMDKNIMHYVPAINEQASLSLAAGAWVSGFKSAVFLPPAKVNKLDFELIDVLGVPIILFTSGKHLCSFSKRFKVFELEEDYGISLSGVSKYVEKNNKPAILFFKEGFVI